MDAIVTPFLLSQGANFIKGYLDRSRAKREEKAQTEAFRKAMFFWIKEELSYNLDILKAWGGAHGDFALKPAQVRRLCSHLQTQICSLVLSDQATMEALRAALVTEKPNSVKLETESEVDPVSEQNHHNGLEALLFIVRKTAVLQRITEASEGIEDAIPHSFNFNVRLKNIKKAHLALYNYLKEYEG